MKHEHADWDRFKGNGLTPSNLPSSWYWKYSLALLWFKKKNWAHIQSSNARKFGPDTTGIFNFY